MFYLLQLFSIFFILLRNFKDTHALSSLSTVVTIAKGDPDADVYYFGVGSNLLKSKITNRGPNGSKIIIDSFVAGYVKDHRLAFNARGMPPLEPAMGGIEPCFGQECHGALVKMKKSEYEKLWKSEGGATKRPGYLEIIVDVFPYGQSKSIEAIAYRSSPLMRLSKDGTPSARYMDIILQGARELHLLPSYIKSLEQIHVAKPTKHIRSLAILNLYALGPLMQKGIRLPSRMLTSILHSVYVPPTSHALLRILSNICSTLVLLPGASLGAFVRMYMILFKIPAPVFVRTLTTKKK
jgi:hypothetical protein